VRSACGVRVAAAGVSVLVTGTEHAPFLTNSQACLFINPWNLLLKAGRHDVTIAQHSTRDESGNLSVFKTIVADLRSNADPSRRTGIDYWSRVLGKAIFAPTVHVVILYRISSALYRWRITRPISFILRSMSVVWGSTEIHPSVRIGPGFCLIHSVKVIIAAHVTIGEDVRISHGVSIGGDAGRGSRDTEIVAPVIGDHVTIGMDAIIMGPVSVGDHSVIGAQSLVIHDIPAYSVVAGSPARVIRRLDTAPEEPSGPKS